LPVFPIHHMEGHLLAPGIAAELPPFPFISLLVSGGHTMLVRVDGIGRYTVVGQTIDDAAGECFDKSARLLGLPYPGGPQIAHLASDGDARRFPLPRPMLQHDNLNFSFSGLKTAVMLAVKSCANETDPCWKNDMAAAIEAAIVEVLVGKSVRACRQHGIPHLVIAGGVAANQRLRAQLHAEADQHGLSVHLPHPRYCTDNGAVIAFAGYCRARAGAPPAEWDARARWSLEQIDAV
ncbi:MAG TPA: tRNA (adenosine(37)-N6)-threonylcarbamoyltransferase complex transferase subunit TsaD, partial [Mariprofundaceae bacterium]|nr:tRNA (adenosine(37)-N6)-threonylcarbamoyltransferase complex transferase subunit TsaD [Mariprofundaceae bacterium]